MLFLFEIANPAAIETIPFSESAGLLGVAILLVGAAVGLRAFLARWGKSKGKDESVRLAGKS